MDGLGVGDLSEAVLQDRRWLSRNGFVVAIVVLDKYTKSVMGEPQLASRGLVYNQESEELFQEATEMALDIAREERDATKIRKRLKSALSSYIYEVVGRRPMVLPVVMEV